MSRFFLKRFIGSLVIALVSLQLTRLVFLLNLHSYFRAEGVDIASAFFYGIRFDLVSMAYLLGPFYLALPFLSKPRISTFFQWYYLIALGFINLLNCIDAEFFRFTARRSTDDLFEFAFLSDDLFNIAPNLLSHFWYLLAAFVAIMLLCWWLMDRLFRSTESFSINWVSGVSALITAALIVVAARGGLQRIPVTIIDASKTDAPELNHVVLNSAFTILKTFGKSELERFEFPADEIAKISPIQYPNSTNRHEDKNTNVVVIIVESLGTEYIGALNGLNQGYTPFVDSLCSVSMVFENSFANGHRSIEGIPAVVASLPTLMYEPYTTSMFASNRINSLANLLKPQGYHTSFMHGGNENSMNFESFAGQAGYDLFFNRFSYPFPNEHYDGYWGISDHYFLNNCVDEFNKFPKPFFSSIFTLSSHHPYSLPLEYQNRFPTGTLPIHESIGYADEALRQFFAKASKTDWYENTLFVITADHTSLSDHIEYQTRLGSLRIPIIFYHPKDSSITGTRTQIMQQVDIMPTILARLGYQEPFFSFGTDALDTTAEHVAVAFKNDQFQVYRKGYLTCIDGTEVTFSYNITEDPLQKYDLAGTQTGSTLENEAYLKAYIQNYSVALNDNLMTFETWTKGR